MSTLASFQERLYLTHREYSCRACLVICEVYDWLRRCRSIVDAILIHPISYRVSQLPRINSMLSHRGMITNPWQARKHDQIHREHAAFTARSKPNFAELVNKYSYLQPSWRHAAARKPAKGERVTYLSVGLPRC